MHLGYLTAQELLASGSRMKSDYGRYIVEIANEALASMPLLRAAA